MQCSRAFAHTPPRRSNRAGSAQRLIASEFAVGVVRGSFDDSQTCENVRLNLFIKPQVVIDMRTSSTSGSFDPDSVRKARALLRRNQRTLPRMAQLYKLLANPARLKILLCLSEIEKMCVGDLAQVLGLSTAATSHQLKLLRDRGWLYAEGQGKLVYYSLTNPGLKEALAGDLRLLSG